MQPFLQSIASAYLHHEKHRLIDTCFIFPNRRSALYLSDYIMKEAERLGITMVMPDVTTIVDFTESFTTETIPADRQEMVFILYGVYRDVVGATAGPEAAAAVDFNRFIQWADVLLNDFDDVDHALADTKTLFSNVENLKELSANYLTEEQIETLGHYFDTERLQADMKNFWNHIEYASDSHATKSFLRIWQVLDEVYNRFRKELLRRGIHSPGMSVRNAVAKAKQWGADDFPMRRYVFVGFDSLTNAQIAIMQRLKSLRNPDGSAMADFYWDTSSPAFNGEKAAQGIQSVRRYAQIFPSLYPCILPIKDFPKINIIGVPSRVGQAKAVGSILENIMDYSDSAFHNTDGSSANNPLRTAIILPEETLLTPILSSLPDNIGELNVTMGYKLRNTAVAGVIHDIATLQRRASRSKGSPVFYYEDVVKLLSNPIIRSFNPEACTKGVTEIQRRHTMSVPCSFFGEDLSPLQSIFTYIEPLTTPEIVIDYLQGAVEWLLSVVNKERSINDPTLHYTDAVDNDPDVQSLHYSIEVPQISNTAKAVQSAFLYAYADALDRLMQLSAKYLPKDIPLEKSTAFLLAERMVQNETLSFDGLPLRGLQIMGVLEARSLDFDTVVIPSMNEKVFPRAKFTASFIPTILRKAFGLSTPDDQENASTYRFYRMISRASNVFLIYDARSTGRRTQPSRFINQLRYIYKPKNLSKTTYSYVFHNPEEPGFVVNKTPAIMQKLNLLRSNGTDAKYLSASAIKLYISCPMSFYLSRVAGFSREDKPTEWIDESTFGTIAHSVLEHSFNSVLNGAPDGVLITTETIDRLTDQANPLIGKLTTRAVNKEFLTLPENELDTPLTGQNKLIGKIIEQYVINTLNRDKDITPFRYLHGEWGEGHDGPLTIRDADGNSSTFNFTCRIDRIDSVTDANGNSLLRIVDYKSGADKSEASSVSEVLTDHASVALIQLILYAEAYADRMGYDGPIQPMVYSLRQLMTGPISPYRIGEAPLIPQSVDELNHKAPKGKEKKWKITDYRDYAPMLNKLLIPIINEIFDPETPFRCTTDTSTCRFCKFTEICRKQ